jgi:hypothetical protein
MAKPLVTYRIIRRYRHLEPGRLITPTHGVAEIYLAVQPPIMEVFGAEEKEPPKVEQELVPLLKTRKRRGRPKANDGQ